MDHDTDIGGPRTSFPSTRRSAVRGTHSRDGAERARAWETLAAAYWKPAYKHIRIKWRESNEQAKDLTQGFFKRAMEKDFFATYDPAKGSFRTFLRVCLDGYVANERKAAHRLKRGGDREPAPLDFDVADGEDYFRKEWIRSLFELSLEELRAECERTGKAAHFRLFERYDLSEERTTYKQLAEEFGIAETSVTNYLAAMRRDFRRVTLATLREITASDEEFRAEARQLLGRK